MAARMDAHHHLWKYTPAGYRWIGDTMDVLKRDFLPEDIEAELKACGIEGAIAVQARQTLEETNWLLDLANTSPALYGVIGWAPLAEKSLEPVLDALLSQPKLKGLRHVVQDEPDDNFILREDFNRGISLLNDRLAYDILIFERHLPRAIEFVDRHPRQRFVLDHMAKPRVRDGVLEPWSTMMRTLAERENVWCKLSGLVTEASWNHWSVENLRPYVETVLEAFGPHRLLYGSDWPVCLLAGGYRHWFQAASALIASLSADEQARILGGNAIKVYH